MMGFFGGFGWMGLFGMTLMLLFWIAIIALAIALARALFPIERRGAHQAAVEQLQQRYAAGEISAAEYEQARRALG